MILKILKNMMEKNMVNEEFEEKRKCDECGEVIYTKYFWGISVTNGGIGGFYNIRLCRKCLEDKLCIPIQRSLFFESLIEYRKKNSLQIYHTKWSKQIIKNFFKILYENKIEIRDYGVPLYFNEGGYEKESAVFIKDVLNNDNELRKLAEKYNIDLEINPDRLTDEEIEKMSSEELGKFLKELQKDLRFKKEVNEFIKKHTR